MSDPNEVTQLRERVAFLERQNDLLIAVHRRGFTYEEVRYRVVRRHENGQVEIVGTEVKNLSSALDRAHHYAHPSRRAVYAHAGAMTVERGTLRWDPEAVHSVEIDLSEVDFSGAS